MTRLHAAQKTDWVEYIVLHAEYRLYGPPTLRTWDKLYVDLLLLLLILPLLLLLLLLNYPPPSPPAPPPQFQDSS